jgi:hypothetical protein
VPRPPRLPACRVSPPGDPLAPGPVDFGVIDRARALFEEAFPAERLPATWRHGNRTFSIQDYLGFMLLALYVPACDSLRGGCKASGLEEFQRRHGCFAMDLASVSKAQAHVPEKFLPPVIARLGRAVQRQMADGAGGGPAGQSRQHLLRVVDSSVFGALPSMTWALFGAGKARKDGRKSASVRFHVSFDPIALCPVGCAVTSAAVDEKPVWRSVLAKRPGQDPADPPGVEVGDRNFGSNYTLLSELTGEDVNFVVRVKEAAQVEIIEELPVGAQERSAGIRRHAWVRLGKGRKSRGHHPVRVIWLERPGKTIVLATNLGVADAPSATVCEMYRHRWQIELFFWWLKKILKVGHWLARSEKGVRIQLYLVMILALLLQLRTGERPTKRMIELLHFHVQGLASDEELIKGLKDLAREADLARESARRRYLAKKASARK